MSAPAHDAWVQGYLAAYAQERGSHLSPTDPPRSVPNHLTEDVEAWSPHHPRPLDDDGEPDLDWTPEPYVVSIEYGTVHRTDCRSASSRCVSWKPGQPSQRYYQDHGCAFCLGYKLPT